MAGLFPGGMKIKSLEAATLCNNNKKNMIK